MRHMRHKIIHPEGWKPTKGYAIGDLSTGTTLHIAGQIGWNTERKFTSDEFIGQMKQALLNLRTVLKIVGGTHRICPA